MSAEASKKRLQNSRIVPKYWRFYGKDIVGLFEEVEEQGAKNISLIATPGLDEEGMPDLHLKIVPEGGDIHSKDHHDYNESHPCPPFCNGD